MRHGPTRPHSVFEPYRLVVMSPTINTTQLPPSLPRSTRLVPDWERVPDALKEYHPDGGSVAVLPYGAIQIAERWNTELLRLGGADDREPFGFGHWSS